MLDGCPTRDWRGIHCRHQSARSKSPANAARLSSCILPCIFPLTVFAFVVRWGRKPFPFFDVGALLGVLLAVDLAVAGRYITRCISHSLLSVWSAVRLFENQCGALELSPPSCDGLGRTPHQGRLKSAAGGTHSGRPHPVCGTTAYATTVQGSSLLTGLPVSAATERVGSAWIGDRN
jgi:hypothetical protein